MGVLIQIFGLLLSLSILIILHELGHFTFAKLFKTRVEKFYLFFDAFGKKLLKINYKGTEYGIGWLPLGGYVKISGMIDESMDKDQLKKPAQTWEFRSKPAWQRLLIMIGGVAVNFILALVIYVFLLYSNGKSYMPIENAKYGYMFDSTLLDIGLKNGDQIASVDAMKMQSFMDLGAYLILDDAKEINIIRDGRSMSIPIPEDFDQTVIKERPTMLLFPRVPFVVDTILPNRPAAKSNLKKDDRIIGINNVETLYFNEFKTEISKYKGDTVTIIVERNKAIDSVGLVVGSDGLIGVGNKGLTYYFDIEKIEYSFLQSIPSGIALGVETLVSYVKQMKLVFSKEGAQQIGGFGSIGQLFPQSWNWTIFWERTALLSIILAFMNILPIPALDGGHVMFVLYEMIVGRKPSDKFLEKAQIIGMVFLFTLLIYANGNDIFRWLSN